MSTPDGRAFDRVVIIMFENEYRGYVRRNPYMRWLADQGVDMATYFGVTHPSNANYTASMAGTIANITKDPEYYALIPGNPPVTPPPMLEETPVVELLRRAGLGWRGYMESYQPVSYPARVDPIMRHQDSATITISITPEAATTPPATVSSPPRAQPAPPPDLTIAVSAPSAVAAGQEVTVAIAVANHAQFQFNVVVEVPTPEAFSLVSVDGDPAQTFPHTTPTLYPGQPIAITAVYRGSATATGPVPLTASVSAVDQPETVRRTILDAPPYLNLHNPFVQFRSIREHQDQWERIGTVYEFFRDAVAGTLPEYSWITPDLWGDGHWIWGTYDEAGERGDVLVDQLARWLRTFFDVLGFPGPGSILPPRTLVVVTFDEADYNVSWQSLERYEYAYDGPNQVYTVLLGDVVTPGRSEGEGFNHYSLLRTVERNFGLGTLGTNDAEANWFQFLWNREFRWGHVAETPVQRADFAAAAGLAETLYVAAGDANGVSLFTLSAEVWQTAGAVPAPAGTSAVAAASCGDQLVLVGGAGGTLSALTHTSASGWSPAQTLVEGADAFAVTGYLDYGDQRPKVMLAWRTSSNEIQSQTYDGAAWASPTAAGHATDGALALAALGPSLFLIHRAVGSDEMQVVSYNTAPFNVVTSGGPTRATTQYRWSPSEFPVAHFGYAPSRATPHDPEPIDLPYRGTAPFTAATLEGVLHLAHPGVGDARVHTERLSLSGVLTPENAVDYQAKAGDTASNGYGTLAQAGWTRQWPIAGVENAGAMTMARFGSRLALLFQPEAAGAMHLTIGEYR